MKNLKIKKQELLNFIAYKNNHMPSKEYEEFVKINNLKNKSYADLREWAIRNDIID